MTRKQKIILFTGVSIFLFSLYLAFHRFYNHFYEFTLTGLFLILLSFDFFKTITLKEYSLMYRIFFVGGLIGDLFLGQIITKLWFYTYSNYLEYLSLYLLIYPLGGIIMVQTYIFLKELLFKIKSNSKTNYRYLKGLFYISFFLFLIILIFRKDIPYFGFCLFSFSSLVAFFWFNYKAQKLYNLSYLGELFNKPLSVVFITFLTAYLQGLVHESPNVFARQWVYQNFPLGNMTFLGINPTVFFIGWIILTVVPVSGYYRLVKKQLK